MNRFSIKLSTISIWLIFAICLTIDFDLRKWEKEDLVIEHDVRIYYGYLPAYFIYNDIGVEKSSYTNSKGEMWFWTLPTPDGKNVFKMSMGLSILYSPFFAAAHLYARNSEYLPDGFSIPYKFFLLLSTLFYLVLGLEFSRKILYHFKFSESVVAITILLIGLGTNILCYASQSAPMPHVYNYFLFSLFIYSTIKWNENPKLIRLIIPALTFGLITLVRPSNGVIIVFFLLYCLQTIKSLFASKKIIKPILIFGILSCIMLVPQFLYWKAVTGNYLYYSYKNESFFFLQPKFIDGLFSFRKGWLVYTPIMIFSIVGLFLMKNEFRQLRNSILIFMLINLYVIFSWWCWWYGGTFGQRALIESYSLLLIPFAFTVKYILERNIVINIAFYSVCVFFIWLNIVQTYQFEYHYIHWDGMNKKLYFKQFGKNYSIKEFDSLVSWPDYEKAKKGKR